MSGSCVDVVFFFSEADDGCAIEERIGVSVDDHDIQFVVQLVIHQCIHILYGYFEVIILMFGFLVFCVDNIMLRSTKFYLIIKANSGLLLILSVFYALLKQL